MGTSIKYESQPGTASDSRYLDWWIVSQPAAAKGSDDRRNLQFVLGAVSAGLWEVDFVSERVTWSPEMYWLHGWDATPRRISAYVNQMVHPDDRSLMRSVLVNMVAEFRERFLRLFLALIVGGLVMVITERSLRRPWARPARGRTLRPPTRNRKTSPR